MLASGSTACHEEAGARDIWKNYFAFKLSRALGMSNVPISETRNDSATAPDTPAILTQWIVDSGPAKMPTDLVQALSNNKIILPIDVSIEPKTWIDLALWSDICMIGYLSSQVN